MAQRKKFTFLESYRNVAEMLDGQERLEFYEAVIAFALDGTEPTLASKMEALFRLVRKDLEKGRKLYENGAKGGRPITKLKPNQNQIKTIKERQKESEEKREKERSKEKENKEEKEKFKEKDFPYSLGRICEIQPKPLGGFGGKGEREGDFPGKGEEAWHKWFENWTAELEKVNLSDYLTEQEDYELMKINGGYGGYMAGAVESFVTSADFNREDSLETKRQKLIEYKNKYNSFLDEKQVAFGTKAGNAIGKKKTEQEYEKIASVAKDEKELRAFLKNKASTLDGYADGQKPRSYEELKNFCDDLGATDFSSLLLWRDMEFHGWEIREKENWRAIKSWKGYVIYRIAAEKFRE